MSEPLDEISPLDRINAYQETQQRDKIGVVGEIVATAAGSGAGYSLASTIAGFFGGNITTVIAPSITQTILSWLPAGIVKATGLVAATTVTTPVGWVIGSTLACGMLAWGLAKLVRNGSIQDERRKQLGRDILKKLEAWFHKNKANANHANVTDEAELIEAIATVFRQLGTEGVLKPDRVEIYIDGVKSKKISINAALNILKEHGRELVNPSINPNEDIDAELSKAASARVFTAMNKGVSDADEPSEAFLDTMQGRFGVERERALALYRDAPLDPNPKATAEQLGQVFCDEVIKSAYEALAETARCMQQGQAAYLRFLEVQDIMNRQFATQIDEIDSEGKQTIAAINRL